MSRLLENLKVGDAVIVSWQGLGPDRVARQMRLVDYVAKVYKNVLQTRGELCGVDISDGRAFDACGSVYVTPATEQDVADVLREIEDRKRADAEYKAKQDAERIAARRIAVLRGEISAALALRVPESVLVRALAVLRGEA
jgi:hypothetical protein